MKPSPSRVGKVQSGPSCRHNLPVENIFKEKSLFTFHLSQSWVKKIISASKGEKELPALILSSG